MAETITKIMNKTYMCTIFFSIKSYICLPYIGLMNCNNWKDRKIADHQYRTRLLFMTKVAILEEENYGRKIQKANTILIIIKALAQINTHFLFSVLKFY